MIRGCEVNDAFSKEIFKGKIRVLNEAYFEKNKIDGINISNNITEEYENGTIVDQYLKQGKIDLIIIGWKAGRLIKDNESYRYNLENTINSYGENVEGYLNGYGKIINKVELDNYIEWVNSIYREVEIQCWKGINDEKFDLEEFIDEFMNKYKKLVNPTGAEYNKEIFVPRNFGSVYVINLLYFLSKGRYPIYDLFAHRALRALDWDVSPCKVFVGTAPEKRDYKTVFRMYYEFVYLIKKIFKNTKYDRELDRALWVYGHATDEFKGLQ